MCNATASAYISFISDHTLCFFCQRLESKDAYYGQSKRHYRARFWLTLECVVNYKGVRSVTQARISRLHQPRLILDRVLPSKFHRTIQRARTLNFLRITAPSHSSGILSAPSMPLLVPSGETIFLSTRQPAPFVTHPSLCWRVLRGGSINQSHHPVPTSRWRLHSLLLQTEWLQETA